MKIEKSQVNFSARRLLVEDVNFNSPLDLDLDDNMTGNAQKAFVNELGNGGVVEHSLLNVVDSVIFP